MREWLTVIVALLILAVVLDGLRRVRQARRSNLRMSARVRRGTDKGMDEGESYGSELPNGGARVAKVRKPGDARQLHEQLRQSREAKRPRDLSSQRIPQQVALNLDEHVPTLMEVEPTQDELSPPEATGPAARASRKNTTGTGEHRERIEPKLSEPDLQDYELQDNDLEDYDLDNAHSEAEAARPQTGRSKARRTAPESVVENADVVPDDGEGEEEFREPEEVLVINVMAPKGEHFRGDALLDTVLECGMRFGSMNIFHHHEGKAVLYSMANIVVPGTFDLAAMKDFSTPGVSLFLALPIDADSGEAFECMLATAKAIAANLGGEMKDENRSVMTAQTVEHYRSRIKEFERKQLSKVPL